MTNSNQKYDLEERSAKFAENVLDLLKNVPRNKDFEHKISICKKEAKETKHWLRMLTKTNPEKEGEILMLSQEAKELCLIFIAIIKKSKINI